jgi:hypothetical protein
MTKTRLLVAIPALVGFSLATSTAHAEPAQASSEAAVSDAVELKNGGYLRGLIIELEPGSHLSLRMPDGQVRRIPIAEIASADRGGKPVDLKPAPGASAATSPAGGATAPATTGAAPVAPAVAAAAAGTKPAPTAKTPTELERILAAIPGRRVKLELDANRSSFLQRRIGEDDENTVAYHLVCKLPCRVELPAGDVVPYRVSNMRLDPTAWFRVPQYNARLKMDLASSIWPVWQNTMIVSGVVFGVTGGSFLGINALTGQEAWARNTGYVLLGVGGASFVAAGLFWLLSPHSTYTIERMP